MIAIIATFVVCAVATAPLTSASTVAADASDNNLYKLSYYGEIEGEVVVDKPVAVSAGKEVTVYPLAEVDGYTFVGWEYDGVVYKVGERFTMPECDVTLNAKWESTTLATESGVAMGDTTMIMIVITALFAIGAIVCTVIIQRMRVNALKSI